MVFDPDNYVEPEKAAYPARASFDSDFESEEHKLNREMGIERYWENGRLRLRRVKK